jgi:hypothetical protein
VIGRPTFLLASPSSMSRETRISSAPSAANALAMPSPMPFEPPVTSTLLPLKFKFMINLPFLETVQFGRRRRA